MFNILCRLFFTFAKIGTFTFGGGYAMIPLFYAELVEKYHLISADKFSNIVAISQITPGPIGINAATYIGYVNGGIIGASVGTLGLLIPSLIIIMVVNKFFEKFRKSELVENILFGVRPAIVGLIFAAVFFFANMAIFIFKIDIEKIKNYIFQSSSALTKNCGIEFGIKWQGVVIFLLAILLAKKFKLSVIWVLIISGIAGMILWNI